MRKVDGSTLKRTDLVPGRMPPPRAASAGVRDAVRAAAGGSTTGAGSSSRGAAAACPSAGDASRGIGGGNGGGNGGGSGGDGNGGGGGGADGARGLAMLCTVANSTTAGRSTSREGSMTLTSDEVEGEDGGGGDDIDTGAYDVSSDEDDDEQMAHQGVLVRKKREGRARRGTDQLDDTQVFALDKLIKGTLYRETKILNETTSWDDGVIYQLACEKLNLPPYRELPSKKVAAIKSLILQRFTQQRGSDRKKIFKNIGTQETSGFEAAFG